VTIHWHLSSRVLLVRNKMTRVPIGCDSPVPAPLLVRVSCLCADWATAFQCKIVGCCCGAWVIIWNSAMLNSTSSLLVNRTYRITTTTTTCESYPPSVVLSNEKVFSFYSTNREESEDSSNCPIGLNRLLWIACFCLLQLLSSTKLCLRCLIQHQTYLLTTLMHGKLEVLCLCLSERAAIKTLCLQLPFDITK
jgi:hypothetical protein